MLDAATPLVQVTAQGTDWPAIAAGISAGVVGLAGIFGTLWQGKRSRETASNDLQRSLEAASKNLLIGINAENERGRRSTRREIYAKCLASLSVLLQALYDNNATSDRPAEQRNAAANSYRNALVAAYSAVAEVQLTAPEEVGRLASQDLLALMEIRGPSVKNFNLRESRDRLLRAMRADLDEST
jgi:hypothetical protein